VVGGRQTHDGFVLPPTSHQPPEGAVAQLGERLICIQEVAGSIPTSSTRFVGGRGFWPIHSVWACSSGG
jgi:hypothetical protein